jgi:hypothetical protein
MNGPDHYRAAEQLLEEAQSGEQASPRALWCLELAKLHTAVTTTRPLLRLPQPRLALTAGHGSKSLASSSATNSSGRKCHIPDLSCHA